MHSTTFSKSVRKFTDIKENKSVGSNDSLRPEMTWHKKRGFIKSYKLSRILKIKIKMLINCQPISNFHVCSMVETGDE